MKKITLALVAAVALLPLAAPAAFARGEGHDHPRRKPPSPASRRSRPKYVCMINNQVFDKEQIPVEVDGKTYYGCCAMCKERLAKDADSRKAVDPVSK